MDPSISPLPQVVVHLGGGHLLATERQHLLCNGVQEHLLEAHASPNPTRDELTHLVQYERGHEWLPLHIVPPTILLGL